MRRPGRDRNGFELSGEFLCDSKYHMDDRFEIGADGRFTLAGRCSEIVKVAGK
jgi:acyl-coenzyme A synthetase/AMP-(fatty) acid ligase